MTTPLCPITGEPAVRHVQWIKSRFLADLWRVTFGVKARSSFGSVGRFGLWESPTGLHFFDPMIEGNQEFYTQFYARLLKRNLWAKDSTRREFELAARHVKAGDRVLDVGCGFASFRRAVPHATYVGLDPNFAEGAAIEGVRNQTLSEHLAEHAGSYDAVCAFQVLEHLNAPMAVFSEMVRAARPGGLVIVGVPHVPSALTRIPNFLLNAPPHHLTWWTATALTALAQRAGVTVESIDHVPWGDDDSLMYWMERCSPIRSGNVYFRNVWTWHAAAVIGYLGGRLTNAVRGTPATTDEGVGLLMVARRPH